MALIPNGLYYIVNGLNSNGFNFTGGSYMDLHAGNNPPGTAIQGWTLNGGNNQKWWVEYFPDESAYVFINDMTGTFASTVQTNSPDPDFATLQSDDNPDYFTISAGGYTTDPVSYTIYSVTDGDYVLDLKNSEGPEIILQYLNYPPTPNQQWIFQPLGNQGSLMLGDLD